MFNKINFEVMVPYVEESAKKAVDILKVYGISVFDLRESDLVRVSDNHKISKVFIICCRGTKRNYEKLKTQQEFTEKVNNGIRTLFK